MSTIMLALLGSLEIKSIWKELATSLLDAGMAESEFPFLEALRSDPQERDSTVIRLGCILSPHPYIFYSALRKARRSLKPQIGTYMESALCESFLVDGVSVDGFSLAPSFRILALRHLRLTRMNYGQEFEAELVSLRAMLDANANQLSPLLQLEAELAWDYVLLPEDEFREKTETQLLRVLRAAVVENRLGMLSWFSSASKRLPSDCIGGDAAWFLSQHCAAHGIDAPEVAVPTDPTASGLSALMPRDLPTVVVGVQRTESHIEFGPPSAERQVGVTIVETNPLYLTVREKMGDGTYSPPRTVKFKFGGQAKVDCGIGELVIGDITGRTFTLAEFTPGSSQSREAMRSILALKIASQAMQQNQFMSARVVRSLEAGYIVKLEPPRGLVGATAYLPSSTAKPLAVGDRIDVNITFIDQKRRWVLANPVFPDWFKESSKNILSKTVAVTEVIIPDEQDERFVDLFMQERPAIRVIPSQCIPADFKIATGDVFPATVVKVAPRKVFRHLYRGETILELGSVHVYIEPSCLLGQVTFGRRNFLQHRPGHLRFPSASRRVDGVWTPDVGTPVEIVVSGEYLQRVGRNREERFMELRLQPMTTKTDWKKRTQVLQRGDRLAATVISIDPKGAMLQARYGKQLLWLPREKMLDSPSVYQLSGLSIGDTLYVQVMEDCTYVNGRGCLLARQLKRAGNSQ